MQPARTALCLAVLCLPVWACVPADPAAVSDGPAPDTASCGANKLGSYIGQPVSHLPAALMAGGNVRVIRPGTAVTMDYSAGRLNVHVNGSGKILGLTCG
jgi:hypothetical protein